LPQPDIDSLRRWGHILLWVSIILPSLGAVAAAARFYVERYEKRLSGQRAEAAIHGARDEALAARNEASAARGAAEQAKAEQAQLKGELDRSQRAFEDLRSKTAPRHLSAAQQQQIIKLLGTKLHGRWVAIAFKLVDGESGDFASDLSQVLQKAGCGVPELIKTSVNDFPGYVVITAHGNVDPEIIPLLQEALTAAGVPVRVQQVKENTIGVWYDNLVHIIVGRKAPLQP
jgi:hypothetical protein